MINLEKKYAQKDPNKTIICCHLTNLNVNARDISCSLSLLRAKRGRHCFVAMPMRIKTICIASSHR